MASPTTILRSRDVELVDRGEGIRTRYLVTAAVGDTSFLTGITEFEPTRTLPFHSHDCTESVLVLSGAIMFETDGESAELSQDDATVVPAGVNHRFANHSLSPARILWIYGSASATRTITATGQTVHVGSAEDRF
jgi:quercetin dioxygenase-like cupin family protein